MTAVDVDRRVTYLMRPPTQTVELEQRSEEGEVLRAAARLIEVDGWCQGNGRDSRGGRCLLNALASAVGPTRTEPHLMFRCWRLIDEVLFDAGFTGRADEWNDAPGRTKVEVTGLLRMAADDADRLGGGAQ